MTHPQASHHLLELRGISKRFGAVTALARVDLTVDAGEVVALVGDNGAGKSTLVKAITGVHAPDSGEIVWEGKPVRLTGPAGAGRLGISAVFQDLALCDNLDVVGNLFLGQERTRFGRLDEHGMTGEAEKLLREMSVTTISSVRQVVGDMSGGQRQAIAIARAVLSKPKLVILDEPTAALGVAQTRQVLDLIGTLRERGLGVILISHNMTDVRQVSDRVVVLRLGATVADFTTSDVSNNDLVASIIGAS